MHEALAHGSELQLSNMEDPPINNFPAAAEEPDHDEEPNHDEEPDHDEEPNHAENPSLPGDEDNETFWHDPTPGEREDDLNE